MSAASAVVDASGSINQLCFQTSLNIEAGSSWRADEK